MRSAANPSYPLEANQYPSLFIPLAVAILCLIPILLAQIGFAIPLGLQAVLATTIQLFCARSIYLRAWNSIQTLNIDTNVLEATAITLAYFYGFYQILLYPTRGVYFEISSIAISVFLTLKIVGYHVESLVGKTLHRLKSSEPLNCTVLPGDILTIHANGRIPVDGVVISGESAIDESLFTQEETVTEKEKGDLVFAGTINLHGTLTIKTTKAGKATALSRSIQLLDESDIPLSGLAQKAKQIFSLIPLLTLSLAFLVWIFWLIFANSSEKALLISLSILFLPSSFALSQSISSLQKTFRSKAFREGILIRDSNVLENIPKLSTLFVDKSSTLQEEDSSLEQIHIDEKYFPLIYTLSKPLESPEGNALLTFFHEKHIPSRMMNALKSDAKNGTSGYFDQRKYYFGTPDYLEDQGIAIVQDFQEGLILALATEKVFIGYFVFGNRLRQGNREAIEQLKKMGIKTIMITQDKERQARRIAESLGFDEYRSEFSPKETAHYMQTMKSKKSPVGFIGDGESNVICLQTADFGFALSNTTDIPMSYAQIGLTRSHLSEVVKAINLSKTANKKIWHNFLFTSSYYPTAFLLAAYGLLPPLLAITTTGLFSLALLFNIRNQNNY